MTSATGALTMDPKAEPVIMPTAMATAFPRTANTLNLSTRSSAFPRSIATCLIHDCILAPLCQGRNLYILWRWVTFLSEIDSNAKSHCWITV